jgi:hypothetical protein
LFHLKFEPQATRIAPSTSTASTQRGVAEADLLELVVFFHETDHPVVAEADLLELVVGEVVGLVMALGVPADSVSFLLLRRAPSFTAWRKSAASPSMRPDERQGIEVAVVEDRGFWGED